MPTALAELPPAPTAEELLLARAVRLRQSTSEVRLPRRWAGPTLDDASPRMERPPDTLAVLAAWQKWLAASYAPPTIRTYWGFMFRFLAHHPRPLAEIGPTDVAAFLATFPYRSSARRTAFQAIKCFYRFAAGNRLVAADPTIGLRVPAVIEKMPRALSTDDVWRLAVAAHARAPIRGWFVLFCYYTACRLTEAQNVRYCDVERTDAGVQLRIRVAKGGRERLIPVGNGLAQVIGSMRVLEPGELLFPRSSQTLWKWVRDAGRDVGIDAHPHLLRSTAATAMLVRGARPHAVREMLGHRNLRTTTRYIAAEWADVACAAGML